MEKLNQHTNQQALTNSIEEGLRLQAQNRLQRMLKQQQKKAAEAMAAQEASNASVDNETSKQQAEQAGATGMSCRETVCLTWNASSILLLFFSINQ